MTHSILKQKKKSDGGNHRSMEGMQQKIYKFFFKNWIQLFVWRESSRKKICESFYFLLNSSFCLAIGTMPVQPNICNKGRTLSVVQNHDSWVVNLRVCERDSETFRWTHYSQYPFFILLQGTVRDLLIYLFTYYVTSMH